MNAQHRAIIDAIEYETKAERTGRVIGRVLGTLVRWAWQTALVMTIYKYLAPYIL